MATAYEDNMSCAICLEFYDDPRFLPCGHSYCLKCLLDVQKKTSSKSFIKCPICQAESSYEYDGQVPYTKNYELNSLVQAFILESKTKCSKTAYLCEICDAQNQAQRACVECEIMYCETCFNACHPMRGKFEKHKIVNADENFKCQKDMKSDGRNMYCKHCDILIEVSDISSHSKHDVVSMEEAHSMFKIKLEEVTGNIDLNLSAFNSSLDKSKDKLKSVVTMFDEIEQEVTRTKAEIISKLSSDVKAAEVGIGHMMPDISAHRELLAQADTISFIENCQLTLQRSTLKQDIDELQRLFEKNDKLTYCNTSIITEIKRFEGCTVPETGGPRITKVSQAIQGKSKNKILVEWTIVKNAENYNIFSKVKDTTMQVASISSTSCSTSCFIDDVDGSKRTELWVTTTTNGRESHPSASVFVPTITQTDRPTITKVSHAIQGKSKNQVLLEWTTVKNAENYNVFSKVKDTTTQVASISSASCCTSCLLDNIDGTDRTELWVTTTVEGRESQPSAAVFVPTVTLPRFPFDHQRAGDNVRVSICGRKISYDKYANELLGDYYPGTSDRMHYGTTVLGNIRMKTGRHYWEVEVVRQTDGHCSFRAGVTSSTTPRDCVLDEEWKVHIECHKTSTTIDMLHANHRLDTQVYGLTDGLQVGLLLDIDKRTLSVFISNENVYSFRNVDATHGFTPTFTIFYGRPKWTLHLVDPKEIQSAPLLPTAAAFL